MNAFDEMRAALAEAENRVKAADNAAKQIARILRGRLRFVDSWIAADLKSELRDFNAHTLKWKRGSK